MTISTEKLETLFSDFKAFIYKESGETFINFKSSAYLNKHENYKNAVFEDAKEKRSQKNWNIKEIGTGAIQKHITAAIQTSVVFNAEVFQNNLIDWRKKDDFAKRATSLQLEQTLFNFFKNKIQDKEAFESFLENKLSYQFIAYLFFIKNKDQFLPITQDRFDQVFDMIGLPDFKTSGNASWENYETFLKINKSVRDFLKTKDPDASLLDAHSFLFILVSQMKTANFYFSSDHVRRTDTVINENPSIENEEALNESEIDFPDDYDDMEFPEGKEITRLHKSKERNKEVVKIAKQTYFKKDPLLQCEVCSFSFTVEYGDLGIGFIEAHHIVPLHSLTEETKTKPEDLAMVCSNCHRMLHRSRNLNTIEALKSIIKAKT